MEFETREYANGDVVVIKIPERLTTDTADDLRLLLKNLVGDEKFKIVIDLTETQYMDSSGLGAVVSKIAATRSHKGDIRLAALQKYVNDLLELTHINQIIKTFDSVEEAVKSFED